MGGWQKVLPSWQQGVCLRAALGGEAGRDRARALQWTDAWRPASASARGRNVAEAFKGVEYQCWSGASNEGSGMQHCPKVKIPEVAEVNLNLLQK